MHLVELIYCLAAGLYGRVVAIDDTHLVLFQIVHIDSCLLQSLQGGQIGILALFVHITSRIAGEQGFQVSLWHISHQTRTEACLLTYGIKDDTAFSCVKGVSYFVEAGTDARPDSHACNHNSIHSIYRLFSQFGCEITNKI